MYDFSRFCLAVIIASLAATLAIGAVGWAVILVTDAGTGWLPSIYDLQILAMVGLGVACVGSLAALAALGLSDRLYSRTHILLLTACGAAAGFFPGLFLALGGPEGVLNPWAWRNVLHNAPFLAILTLAGAAGGWTFAKVWQTSR